MKRLMFAAALSAMALAGAPAALADSFTPAGSTFVFSGTTSVTAGVSSPLTCSTTMTIVSNGAGNDASVTSMGFAGGLCAILSPINLPWNIDVVAPTPPPTGVTATQLALRGMTIRTLTGINCGPEDTVVQWNAGPPPSITFPIGTEINPPVPGCLISGSLTQTNGPPYLVITN